MTEQGKAESHVSTIRRLAALVGFVLGAPCTAVLMAVTSGDCAHLNRALTVFPPGLQCSGPKDDLQVPWGSQGPGAVPLVLFGGLLGAFLFWFLAGALSNSRQRRRK